MTTIFRTPFAEQGDKQDLPSTEQPDGSVSMPTGWTSVYELENTEPGYKPVGRMEMNGVIHDITEAIGEMQLNGFSVWQAIPGGYPAGAIVSRSGVAYRSKNASNTQTPSATATGWDQLPTADDLSGKEPSISAGTTGQYWRGDKTWQSLNKSAVGLGNVDNTSDANKPVSTAQQTALNLKANLASPALTGNPTAPTQAAGNNSTRLATTAFVMREIGSKTLTRASLLGSRAIGVTYTHPATETQPLFLYVSLYISGTPGQYGQAELLINGVSKGQITLSASMGTGWGNIHQTVAQIVLPGETYRINQSGQNVAIRSWDEVK